MVEFHMPSLGADMEAGTLVEWLVKPGDWVKRGDIVAVVETQKGAIEIETFQAGQIEKILVDLKSKVPVGTPLAQISNRTGRQTRRSCATARGAASSACPAPGAGPPCTATHRPGCRAPGASVARSTAARRRTRHRSFNGRWQRPSGGDHLCGRRVPSRRGRRSAGNKASTMA